MVGWAGWIELVCLLLECRTHLDALMGHDVTTRAGALEILHFGAGGSAASVLVLLEVGRALFGWFLHRRKKNNEDHENQS